MPGAFFMLLYVCTFCHSTAHAVRKRGKVGEGRRRKVGRTKPSCPFSGEDEMNPLLILLHPILSFSLKTETLSV